MVTTPAAQTATNSLDRYYFPHNGEDLELMHLAAQRFVGEHDFRNFCSPAKELWEPLKSMSLKWAGRDLWFWEAKT